MARFTVNLPSRLDPRQTWDRLWDLRRHTATIPFTKVSGGPVQQGSRFVGRTGVGPVGFDDPMVATRFQPPTEGSPGYARVDKTGRVITGRIDVTVRAQGSGSVVDWTQEIGVIGVPAVLGPVVALVASLGYRTTLRRIVGS